eukprot:GEZU01017253.1.p1 GENE.GEZU01017253.1~~GEZU01017253.1.p1  ORF type:complete len:215 (-),score=44.11 GEZU01017253.1:206-796(-)
MEPAKKHKTAIVSEGRKKIHTTFDDGSEMVEEYDLETDELVVRKTRKPTKLGGEGEWFYEIGAPTNIRPAELLIAESNNNPVFVRKDATDAFQWRVRNLLYPKDVYSVSVDEAAQEIVIRTSNKKYYKRFDIPDMKRAKLKLDPSALSWTYTNNTLLVSYKKPDPIIQAERQAKQERQEMKNKKPPREGDVDCQQQ